MLTFKEALLISAQGVLEKIFRSQWEWCNMLENGITTFLLAYFFFLASFTAHQPDNIRETRKTESTVQGSSPKSYLQSKDNNSPLLIFSMRHFTKYTQHGKYLKRVKTRHHLALWIQLPYSGICRGGQMEDISSSFLWKEDEKTH